MWLSEPPCAAGGQLKSRWTVTSWAGFAQVQMGQFSSSRCNNSVRQSGHHPGNVCRVGPGKTVDLELHVRMDASHKCDFGRIRQVLV